MPYFTINCSCGAKVTISISEGSSPGCAEREEVDCPKCSKQLHSGVYNDASVSVSLVEEGE